MSPIVESKAYASLREPQREQAGEPSGGCKTLLFIEKGAVSRLSGPLKDAVPVRKRLPGAPICVSIAHYTSACRAMSRCRHVVVVIRRRAERSIFVADLDATMVVHGRFLFCLGRRHRICQSWKGGFRRLSKRHHQAVGVKWVARQQIGC